MPHTSQRIAIAGAVLFAGTLAACSSPATAPTQRQPVSLRVSSLAASPSMNTVAGLQLSTVRLSIGQTSLGNGDQFGCQNCQNGGAETAESSASPSLVTIPATGGSVVLATEYVTAGTYSSAEIDLVKPTTGVLGQAAENTIEVNGSYQGKGFSVAVPVLGTFVQTLSPPVTVSGTQSTPLSATLTLPVASWFSANGVALNPSDPTQLAQIQANIRSYFSAPEAGGRGEGE